MACRPVQLVPLGLGQDDVRALGRRREALGIGRTEHQLHRSGVAGDPRRGDRFRPDVVAGRESVQTALSSG